MAEWDVIFWFCPSPRVSSLTTLNHSTINPHLLNLQLSTFCPFALSLSRPLASHHFMPSSLVPQFVIISLDNSRPLTFLVFICCPLTPTVAEWDHLMVSSLLCSCPLTLTILPSHYLYHKLSPSRSDWTYKTLTLSPSRPQPFLLKCELKIYVDADKGWEGKIWLSKWWGVANCAVIWWDHKELGVRWQDGDGWEGHWACRRQGANPQHHTMVLVLSLSV